MSGLFSFSCQAQPPADPVTRNLEIHLFQIRSAQIRELSAISNGRVADVSVSLGQEVRAGDLLFRLQVDRLDADLRRALVNYRGTRSTLRQNPEEDGKDPALTELRELADRFRKQAVIAPFTGIIDRFQVLQKEQVRIGQPVARIVETTRLQVRIPVDGSTVSIGQEVPLLLTEGRTVGRVVEVLPPDAEAQIFRPLLNSPGIALIVIDNRSRFLRDGDFAVLPAAPYGLIPDA
ncbi:MAG: HlyD family efflux transporter periplasmic adaptor subunit, partial [Planctomycetaceae bacterium]|nr:HlyD family efflux transporter periplasmic adaptor subunit [Planctomycetaceae bacterium]